ncbi:NAD(P)-dependent oxidoreductase [Nocardioides sp. L-11A]|uniref:NAD(P)-dependent oxidoreductase n=1 Tax=Nocardioides sp. L-11A TaxID=3043848 RepID=UPI00249C0835|nr:NAD(P)-dependent oxidoreductase [Nocardioides sp. L-11A]
MWRSCWPPRPLSCSSDVAAHRCVVFHQPPEGNPVTNAKPSAPTHQRSVGVLGLGTMGSGMAATLHSAGWDVCGYDPAPEARSAAAADGVPVVDSIAALRGSVMVMSLPGADVVERCVPLLLDGRRGLVIIDTTTSHPRTSREMEALCDAADSVFVDAPVSGGRVGAWSGTLTAFVGGRPAAVDAAEPVLASLTSTWRHLGPSGSGNVVKLLNNLLCAANLASVAEAIDVLDANGLDVAAGLDALNDGSGRSAVSQVNYAGILRGELVGGFAVGLMARDVRLGLSVAKDSGATPTVLAATEQLWAHALEVLGPQADCNIAPSAFTTATDRLHPRRLGAVEDPSAPAAEEARA